MATNENDFTPEDRATVEAMAAIWYDVMSKGDRGNTMLAAKPPEPGDTITLLTAKGSPIDRFWSLMQSLGWADAKPAAIERLPSPETFAAFALNDAGEVMLPKFLRAVC
jgi:hypothetical protein